MSKVIDRGMDAVWNGGDVRLPRLTRMSLRIATDPKSGWCVSRQPTWERALTVAAALLPTANDMGLRLRIRRHRRTGLWAIAASRPADTDRGE